MIAQYIPLSIQ